VRFGGLAAALVLTAAIAWPTVSAAQAITSDGSLGTAVTNGGGDAYTISGGAQRGNNLFHSFGLFSVPSFGSATFDGPPATANVISRVTGGQVSSIDGLISTRGGASPMPGANFFLINPAGVVLGPFAALDVGGAFRISTADYIRLADGVVFSAVPGAGDALLSSAPPQAFGFLSNNPASITLDGAQLVVDPAQTLSIVGGNVQMLNGAVLAAPAGVVEVGSAASPGVAPFDAGLDMSQFSRLGEVRISGGGIAVGDGVSNGSIVIRSGQLVLEAAAVLLADTGDSPGAAVGIDIVASESMIVREGALVQTISGGLADASDISIRAGNLTVTGTEPSLGFTSTIESRGTSAGRAGTINLNVANVLVSGEGVIQTISSTSGAGDIRINATGTVTVTGALSEISTDVFETSSPLLAGDITVNARDVVLSDRGKIRSGGSSTQGGQTVSISAANSVSISGLAGIEGRGFNQTAGAVNISTPVLAMDAGYITTSTFGTEGAGTIFVNANTVNLANGAQIASSSQDAATGAGGAISINASGSVTIGGTGPAELGNTLSLTNSASSGLFGTTETTGSAGQISVSAPTLTVSNVGTISVATSGPGSGGNIVTNVGNLNVNGGARIDSSTTAGGAGGAMTLNASNLSISGANSGLFSTASSTGNAGQITVTAGNVTVAGGGVIDSSTTGAGAGGAINVSASGQVAISSGGSVRADSLGAGNTGSITIAAGDRIMMESGSISTRAATADGGNITLLAPNVIRLANSQITTSVESGTGSGGNIFIDPQFVILTNSTITANAFGGPGGNITIIANNFIADPSTSIVASSALSTPGTVQIESPDNNVAGDIAQLPRELVDSSRLLASACSARRGGAPSSFTVAGRGGVPVDPDGYLPSYSMSDAPAVPRAGAGYAVALAMAGWECWQ
jgi:filamentous hemagglutinin family protein